MTKLPIWRVFVLALAMGLPLSGAGLAQDKVINFAKEDPVMNAAINKARDTLPEFWQMFAAPQPGIGEFALKLAIAEGADTEHFWCVDIQGNAQKATCRIANEPEIVHTVAMDQTVDVDPRIISDWMYRKDGKIVGGQTIRVMITTMAPEEAEQYKSMLADE